MLEGIVLLVMVLVLAYAFLKADSPNRKPGLTDKPVKRHLVKYTKE